MAFEGSAARRLDQDLRTGYEAQRESRPSFEVFEGKGLDAQVRQGVSPLFLSLMKLAAVVAVAIAVLGAMRVALTAATVSTLQANNSLEIQIDDAINYCKDLQVDRSVYASATRIDRIATQNLGMEYCSDAETVVMPTGEDESASLEEQFSQAGDASSADAAQTSSAAVGDDAKS